MVGGPLIGGFFASVDWRWAFWLNVPVAGISLVIVLAVFPSEKDAACGRYRHLPWHEKVKRLDLLGAVSLIASLCCLMYMLQELSISAVFTTKNLILTVCSAGLLAIFLVHSFFVRREMALIPRHILKYRMVWSTCIGLFFLFAGFTAFAFFLFIFFQVCTMDLW